MGPDDRPYVTGLRNLYDFVFRSDGQLYEPDNAPGATGTFPPSPTPPCDGSATPPPGPTATRTRGTSPTRCCGRRRARIRHPNPSRGECAFKDGSFQGVDPLPNRSPPLALLGNKLSANGIIEYDGGAFGGALDGDLIIANHSKGDHLTRVQVSADGTDVVAVTTLVGWVRRRAAADAAARWHDLRRRVRRRPGDRARAGGRCDGATADPVAGHVDHARAAARRPPRSGRCRGRRHDRGGGWQDHVGAPVDDVRPRRRDRCMEPGRRPAGPAVENPAAVAYDGTLYVFGGRTPDIR